MSTELCSLLLTNWLTLKKKYIQIVAIHLTHSSQNAQNNVLGEDVELFCHLNPELFLLESVSVTYNPTEVLQQGGYVGQQQPGALS